MSPQFVDFNADGKLDIVAGTFDGSPHLARGSDQGWQQPEQILDASGARIMLNQYWDFDKKRWMTADGCEFTAAVKGHATSAVAFDLDGDGDLDLLLGDHTTGSVYVRANDGTTQKPAFGKTNAPLLADGKPIDVPGTVATLRLVDWDGDGRVDLLAGGMGNAFGGGNGGVYLYRNTGSGKAASFAAPVTLIPAEPRTDGGEPVRPDSGHYMDAIDLDGDGDLDLVVGGYSHWQPKPLALSDEQKAQLQKLKADLAELDKKSEAVTDAIDAELKGLDEAAADKKRTELYAAKRPELTAIGKQRNAVQQQIEPLEATPKRVSYVWFYENLTRAPAAAGR